MSETVERIYPEAVNLRSMARFERKQGNVELAGVLEGTADLYERTASDLESATKSLHSHSAVVIEQQAEITKLKSQLEEARAKAINDAISALQGIHHYGEYGESGRYVINVGCKAIRALLNASANKEGGKS